MRRSVFTVVGLVVLCLLLAEGLLQLGALFMRGREHAVAPGAAIRILCIGDSHTFGGGVEESESYPAHLQAFLDAQERGRYAVINAGVPGTNTAQWRERLPNLLNQYQPQVVVIWMGVNDSWNGTGFADSAETLGSWLHAIASRSRFYRLINTWRHDYAIDTARLKPGARLDSTVDKPMQDGATWTVRHDDGTVEVIRNDWHKTAGDDATRQAVKDFKAIVALLQDRQMDVLFISYPLHNEFYEPANRAIQQVGTETGVPVIDGTAASLRVPEPERKYLWADHPSGPIYREIARDLSTQVLAASAAGGSSHDRTNLVGSLR